VVCISGGLASTSLAATSALTNGDFEAGSLTGWTSFVTQNGGIDPSGVEPFNTTGTDLSSAAYFMVGEIAGQVGGGPEEGGGIYQSVTLSGGTYVVSADVAVPGGGNADCGTFSVLIDGTVVDTYEFGQCLAVQTYRATLSATVPLDAGTHEVRILITRNYGPSMRQYVDNVSLTPLDSTPPMIRGPGDVIVDATGPSGATVAYSVTATDDVDGPVPVTCVPPSSSLVAIGTTTVNCTASDTNGNTSSASFTIRVKGAAEQLAGLLSAVTQVGPGTSLADKVTRAQAALGASDVADACSTLNALINQLKAQSGKRIPAEAAASLIGDATRIRAVLGC
jgi:hypothetical protein